jgi:hypothetical protein
MSEAGQRTVAQIAAEAEGLRARGFCHGCVPAVPVCEAACVYCGAGRCWPVRSRASTRSPTLRQRGGWARGGLAAGTGRTRLFLVEHGIGLLV